MKKAKEKPSKEMDTWFALGFNRLQRSRHVHHCVMCRSILWYCGLGDEDYLARARDIIVNHEKKVPIPEAHGCRHIGCVYHEPISRELANQMIDLGGGDKPSTDINGVLWTCIEFIVRETDHPEGFDMTKQDIMHRYFKYLLPSAGHLYIRLGPKNTIAHVRVDPAYKSRHESIYDLPTLEDIVETFEKTVPKIKEWVLQKYRGLKTLAEGELVVEKEE